MTVQDSHVKSTPSKCSGSTLIGCLRCGASLNLQHGYFGCDGRWDPTVINFLNSNTRDFWFSDDEQIKLGMEPGAPKAAHFCTAETMQPGCRMGSISVWYAIFCWMYRIGTVPAMSPLIGRRHYSYSCWMAWLMWLPRIYGHSIYI